MAGETAKANVIREMIAILILDEKRFDWRMAEEGKKRKEKKDRKKEKDHRCLQLEV
jgi:hypothetical protein